MRQQDAGPQVCWRAPGPARRCERRPPSAAPPAQRRACVEEGAARVLAHAQGQVGDAQGQLGGHLGVHGGACRCEAGQRARQVAARRRHGSGRQGSGPSSGRSSRGAGGRTQQHQGPGVQVHECVDEVAVPGADRAANDVCMEANRDSQGQGAGSPQQETDRQHADAAPRGRGSAPDAPLMNLVSECTTTSAPSLQGPDRWQQVGVRHPKQHTAQPPSAWPAGRRLHRQQRRGAAVLCSIGRAPQRRQHQRGEGVVHHELDALHPVRGGWSSSGFMAQGGWVGAGAPRGAAVGHGWLCRPRPCISAPGCAPAGPGRGCRPPPGWGC